MTNDEPEPRAGNQMTKEARMTNDKTPHLNSYSNFIIGNSFVIWHSSFVIPLQ
jgi:hypothetical protein